MKRFTAILARITIPVFLLLIFIPFIWSLPGVHGINLSRFEDMEKRAPNEYPALPSDRQELAAFPGAFEKAFNDHFGFRRDLITIFKLFKYNVFNQSTDPNNVVVGKDGWLYLGNDYFRTFDRHTGSRPPLEGEVDRLITAERRNANGLPVAASSTCSQQLRTSIPSIRNTCPPMYEVRTTPSCWIWSPKKRARKDCTSLICVRS